MTGDRRIDTIATARAPTLARRRDRLGRLYWSPNLDTACADQRFTTFQRQVLEDALPPHSRIAAHLIAFDAICDLDVLERALAATEQPYRWRDNARIEWADPDGYCDARDLSPLTQITIARTRPLGMSARQQIAALASWLSPGATGMARLQNLVDDARAWLMFRLPGYAFGHCSREARLNLLPRDCLAREAIGFALTSDTCARADRIALCEAMDGALSDCSHTNTDMRIIQALVESTRLGRRSGGSHDAARRRILDALGKVAASATGAGRVAALIAAWLIDMVESGSPRTALYAPNTIANYAGAAAEPLADALAQRGGLPPDATGYEALYAAVKSTHSAGQQKNCASALSSFHRFVMRWFDAPPLATRLHEDVPLDVPAAGVIWPHELEHAVTWAAEAADERMGAQLALGLSLGGEIRLRTQELLHLRLRNVRLETRQIEVFPMRRDGRTKSTSGVRIGKIRCDSVLERLAEWVTRRRKEGAGDEDLLLGDPHADDQVYRAGTLVVGLTALLQASTGDYGVCFHTLSHTFVTDRVAALAAPTSATEINPVDEMAAEAGHFTAATSFRYYAHRIEPTIRAHLDAALLASGLLSSAVASHYTNIAAATLRQRARRSARGNADAGWAAIEATARTLDWARVDHGITLREPVAPAWLGVVRSSDLTAALNALVDLSAGVQPEDIARRVARTRPWVERVALAAVGLMMTVGLQPQLRRMEELTASEACEILADSKKTTTIDFRRARQARFTPIARRVGSAPTRCMAAFRAWARAFRRGLLSLSEFDVAQSLLTFLAEANIPVGQLAICTHAADGADRRVPALQGVIRSHYGVAVPVIPRRPMRGRPDLYLLWSSSHIESDTAPPAAACNLDGLHAWMIAFHAATQAHRPTNTSGD